MRRNASILVIDDEEIMREILEALLTREGYLVHLAASGEEGVELAKSVPLDAAVVDVMMPGMDGWETCTRIKCDAVTADIPVILLTGADDRDLSQHANAVGASALLQKPCPADRLRETIVSVLDGNSVSKR